MTYIYNKNELYHFGIKGQKCGIRRYQNSDGSLTEAGKRRYYNSDGSLNNRGLQRKANRDRATQIYNNTAESLTVKNKEKEALINDHKKRKFFSNISDDVSYYMSPDMTKVGYKNMNSKNKNLYRTKSEAADAYMHELEEDIKSNKAAIATYRNMAKKLKSADISENTFFEEAKRNNAVSNGIKVSGLLMGTVGYVLADVFSDGNPLADLATIGAGATAYTVGELMKKTDREVYEKYYAK